MPIDEKKLKADLTALGVTNIGQAMLASGVELAKHESDLYVYATPLTKKILSSFGKDRRTISEMTFSDQVGRKVMFDVPFMYPEAEDFQKFPANVVVERTGYRGVKSPAHWGEMGLDIPFAATGVDIITFATPEGQQPVMVNGEAGLKGFSLQKGAQDWDCSFEWADGQKTDLTLSHEEFAKMMSGPENNLDVSAINRLVAEAAPKPEVSDAPSP
ncbi:hypothetical protein CSR02_08825 [Acetobacter pomorum]|uniref:Uncharacterized protein n=1 Tax=Acetobacter pomorum TaxID=65959 RepID=A0A2G4RBT6_9PROT|nr:hypothetical protein [Acetobacter pomorum]PHY93967.1 hypothetical protein CSR02_08825 [Acetobacter pomorum]GBR54248.1 hypothetical protein AA11825_2634 [Acetobacter pomorum DSM 11825]